MTYAQDENQARGYPARGGRLGLLHGAIMQGAALQGRGPQTAPDTPAHDWKKHVIVFGLGALSWVATYVGMLELIEANTGELPILHKLIIAFSVAMLMTMIIWLLDQIFSPIGVMQRLAYVAGYIFLSIISVGFGFGFYWKVLESRSESSRSAEMAVSGVQSSLNGATTRLEQLNATLLQLATVSREKAELERAKGTSCPNSKPGDGPRRRMREEDAARFSFASEFVSVRVAAVKTEIGALDADLAKIAKADPSIVDVKTGTRNDFMKGLGRKLDMTVSSFNALRTDPQLSQLRADLTERAERTTFGDPKAGGFVCPDTQLSQALRGASRAIAELPVLEKPTIAAVEGSEATIEAFRRLTASFYGLLTLKMPPSADELRELQKKAMQSAEGGSRPAVVLEAAGLSKRDYVPLAIAIFVDICLLLVAMGAPAGRLTGLVPKMRQAERGPVIEILSRFNDIHRDESIRENFDLFRHVVFDLHGAYYVAVPLDAPKYMDADAREALRVEAQLLANLFTSFEQDRIFRRSWLPLTATIKSKLAQQGSKFANSEAFRVYRFRDGAWSEIILGAVMGAAHRAEAEAQRRLVQRDVKRARDRAEEPVLSGNSSDVSFEPRLEREAHTGRGPGGLRAPTPGNADHQPQSSQPVVDATQRLRDRVLPPDADFVAKFGAHARTAEVELTPRIIERAPPLPAANSNTAPHGRSHATSYGAQMQVAEALPAAEPITDRIDMIVKRETATVSFPVGDAADRNSIIGRLSDALGSAPSAGVETAEIKIFPGADVSPRVLPHLDQEEHPGAFTETEEFEQLEELESDSSTADAVTIAGRLRPIFAGE